MCGVDSLANHDVENAAAPVDTTKSGPQANLITNESAIGAMRLAIWFLLGLYCLPFVIAGYSVYLISEMPKTGPVHTGVLNWFFSFTSGGANSLSLIHRALLPLMAGFAPVAFRSSNARSSSYLMLSLIVAIGASIFLMSWYDEAWVATTISQLGAGLSFDQKQTVSFFSNAQEILGMYLLVLFGLNAAK